ncbi:hypothetical protein BRARA_G01362 [Brassica rapa]|uniref:Uncharacterized protein n=1 Tax=Brassica campestris TaxID=3711 RepID=A0A397YMM2_BRACM|nr:hypothetical protein BRARA_G01362 [Brassica rapa]
MLDACPGDVDSRRSFIKRGRFLDASPIWAVFCLNFLGFSFIVNSKSDTKCGNSQELVFPIG